MTERLCAVSVDLDAIDCYYRIHGLSAPRLLRDPVYGAALPRFLELFEGRHVPATFFVVGENAVSDLGRELLPRLRAAGHELGNHSHTHPYDLFRLPPDEIARELQRAHEAIAAASGAAPRGFRAPGYGLSPALLEAVSAAGYTYDSSVLPSPPYYGAKAAIMGLMRLGGQRSRSALADPRLVLAPTRPYRPNPAAPWRRGHSGLIELPISVVRGLGVPVIGTALVAAPAPLRRLLVAALERSPVVNLELHGLDLVDAEVDAVAPELRARQPDLRVPVGHKRVALGRTLDELTAAGYRFVTLAQLAQMAQRGAL